jgi:2-desacetyl-2-hydroxyethyl bacteriochlorophyllide A dehydrogenase
VKAVRALGDGTVSVVDVDASVPAYARDPVRVAVRSAGICGSDLHLLSWALPATFGHEIAGVLDDGTAVAVQPLAPCGTCDRCRAGAEQLCRHSGDRLHGVSIDGGLAEAVIVDRSCLVALPDGVAARDGALVEPVAVAVHSAHRAGMHDPGWDGGRVLVIGGGSIGLAMIAVALEHGADVDAAARHPAQRAAAERLGARPELAEEYDLVFDCAGSQSSLDQAIARLRPGGTIMVPGTFWHPVQLTAAVSVKEVRLVMSQCYGRHHGVREFAEAAAVLAARPELVDAMVTHRFALDDAAEAFRVAADRASGAIKVVVEP